MSIALPAVRAVLRIPASAGGPGQWTPASFGTDLALWLDADDPSTITASSGLVSSWADKSGNGRNAVTAVEADKPTTVANVVNGRAIVRFAGDRLNAPVPAGTFPNGIQVTVVAVKTGGAATFEAGPVVRTVAGVGRGFDRYNTGILNNPEGFGVNSTVNMQTATSWMVLSTRTNGSGSAEWRNGTQVANGTNAWNYADLATQIQVGRRDNNGTSFTGDLAEVVVTPFLSVADRQKLEGYLAHRWGLAASLPSDHPYVATPPSSGVTTAGVVASQVVTEVLHTGDPKTRVSQVAVEVLKTV